MPKERLRASAAASAVTGGRLLKCFPPDFSQHGVASPHAAAAAAATAGNPVYVLATEEDTLMMMEPGMDTASSPAGECSIDNQTNLIVNYLPQTMTQDDIRTLFASLGELESCKLVRDKTTGQSLGYGFVKYTSPISAQNAINAFNGLRLQNKTIKVSLARPSSDTIKGANLYISGLSKNFTSHELNSLFAPYGNIISTRVLCDPLTGLSKGVGFIRFNLRTEAEMAIKQLNGTTPPGAGSKEPITVKFASQPTTIVTKPVLSSSLQLPQQQQQLSIATASMLQPQIPTASHVGLAPHLIQVHPYFQPLNRIRYASLDGVYPSTIQPMTTANTAAPTASSASAGTWTLFVYNLPPDVEDNVIWRLFGPYGAVQSVKVMRDAATQKCKGYGFVTMTNYEEAALAIAGVNGHQLDNHILQVSFKRTQQQVQPVATSVATAAGTPLNGCTLPNMIPFGLASGISQGQAPPNFLNQATLIQNLGFPGFTNQGFLGIANPGFAGLAGAGFPPQAAIPISIL